MNIEQLKKIGRGALIAGTATALTYIIEAIPGLDLPEALVPAIVGILSVLVNVVRKL